MKIIFYFQVLCQLMNVLAATGTRNRGKNEQFSNVPEKYNNHPRFYFIIPLNRKLYRKRRVRRTTFRQRSVQNESEYGGVYGGRRHYVQVRLRSGERVPASGRSTAKRLRGGGLHSGRRRSGG